MSGSVIAAGTAIYWAGRFDDCSFLFQVLKDASVLDNISFYAIHLLTLAVSTPSQWKVSKISRTE